MSVLLVSAEKLKTTTNINSNLEDSKLIPSIRYASKTHIQPVLGSTLFTEIETQVSGGTLTTINKALLDDFIQESLIYWAYYEILPFLQFKIDNIGITKNSDDNSQPIEDSEFKFLRSNIKNKAEWHSERLRKYLIENSTDFDAYTSPGSGLDIIKPDKSTTYNSGIVFPDSNLC